MARNRVSWVDKWGGFSEGKIKQVGPPRVYAFVCTSFLVGLFSKSLGPPIIIFLSKPCAKRWAHPLLDCLNP
jgi:hypothetical protein